MKQAIICDLDGTLALIDHRDPYDASTSEQDELNEPVAEVLRRFAPDYAIILVSGRMDTWKPEAIRWLEKHQLPYDELFMRRAKDFRKDFVVKKEILTQKILPKYEVFFLLDDRNQVVNMWREEGYTCFQVAPGDF